MSNVSKTTPTRRSKNWIDYDALKEQLTLTMVLDHFDVSTRGTGDQKSGFCPLPAHQSKTDGRKRSPSFSAHLGKGAWHCFGCGRKGNALELAVRLLGLEPDDPKQFRDGTLRVRDELNLAAADVTTDEGSDEAAEGPQRRQSTRDRKRTASKPKRAATGRTAARRAKAEVDSPASTPPPVDGDEAERQDDAVPEPDERVEEAGDDAGGEGGNVRVLVNAPLDFELQGLDPRHPYLADRDLGPETVAHFGLGYCKKGLMRGRIAISIRDEHGRLVAYGGRLVDDEQVDEGTPKYRFPGPVEKEDEDGETVRRVFRKSDLLYHASDLWPRRRSLATLYVVEGFPACWWLWQLGLRDVVAVMGSSCSGRQAQLLIELAKAQKPGEPTARLVLVPDGDDAGRRLAADLLPRVAGHCWCRLVELPEGTQPTDFDADGLRKLWH